MKKIYLLILSIASMCFAGNVSMVVVPHNISNGFYIFNGGNVDVNGFKFYYYFNAAPVEDLSTFSAQISRKQLNGSYTYDQTVMPKTPVKFERLSANKYRAIFDYSNVVIPARGQFPTSGKPLNAYTSLSISISGVNDDWAVSFTGNKDNVIRAYVVESLSGELLVSKRSSYDREKKKFVGVDENHHPITDAYRRIGVLTDASTCDEFVAGNKNNLLNTIKLDVEDRYDQTSIQGATPIGIQRSGSLLQFKYCTLAIQTLPRTPYDYMVLRLDSKCPEGSYPVTRNHDTENWGNIDSYSGNIWPSSVVKGDDTDATLEYCYVPKVSSSTLKYPFNKKYGVFACSDVPHVDSRIATSTIFVDDENDNNHDWWSFKTVPLHLQSRMQTIMSGGHDTEYHVIKWTGTESQRLAKSAAEIAEAPISAEKTLVAAVPHAPAIKGLNRSAVAVELKSEGNVKVSIVNANGFVIANIAQEKLQAGVHQIKWNSGMVPSGRYIVKVEQNGMVNARNVVLK